MAASASKAENLDINMEIIGSGNTFGNDEDEAIYLDEKSGQFKLSESTLGIQKKESSEETFEDAEFEDLEFNDFDEPEGEQMDKSAFDGNLENAVEI